VTWKTPEGSIAGNGDVRMHEAYLCGLEPGTTYGYRVGGGAAGSEVWSEVRSFTTVPVAGAEIKIAVAGDSRGEQQDAWRILQQRILSEGVALQLFSGDMTDLASNQGEWERWLDSAEMDKNGAPSALSQLLTVSAHGNHDNHGTLFFANMVMPQDVGHYPQYTELFYSFDAGPVHIVVLDDGYIGHPDADYMSVIGQWLEDDLTAAAARRATVPWSLVMHHHPPFSSSNHGKDADVMRIREYVVPIYDKHHVDLVVSGHDHNYERSKPLTGPATAPVVKSSAAEGTTYLVCAGAGAEPYSPGTSSFTDVSHGYNTGGALGVYAILTATATSLEIRSYDLTADGSGAPFDHVTLTK
jgi:acid phosphatase type 7